MNNNLFGGLGGNTTQVGDIGHLFAKIVVNLDVGIHLASLFQGNFDLFVPYLFNYGSILEDLDLTKFLIKLNLDITDYAILFSDCGTNRLFNGIHQQLAIYSLVTANLIKYSL